MGFESGSVTFRMLYVPRPFPKDAVDRFARHAAPPLDTLSDGEINGWVTGRHLLDRHITEDTATYGGFLRLTLMKAERKVPESLLRAECRMEELAQLAASGQERLSASVRSEIRKSITARLLPTMPPTLKGIPVVHRPGTELLYCGASSDKQLDALQAMLVQAIGFGLIPVLPESAAIRRLEKNVTDWGPVSFSPEVEDDECDCMPGREFLTWLWFLGEARGGVLRIDGIGELALLVEGPLLFVREGAGAHETSVRNGEPLLSAEAKASLLAGKKLRRAKLTLARGDESFSFGFDADTFVIRSLKIPETEKLDPVSRFQTRMQQLDLFTRAFLGLFDRFVHERHHAGTWQKTREEIHRWVNGRKVRR